MKALDRPEGKRLHPALRWLISMLFLLIWSAGIGLISLWFAAITYGPELFDSYFSTALLPLLNLLPGLLLALLVFCVTNRVWPAVAVSGLVVFIASFSNYFLLMTRSETLLARDLLYIKEAAGFGSRYSITLTPLMWGCFALVLAATVLSLFAFRARFTKWLPRVILLVLVLVGGYEAWTRLYSSDELYARTENMDVDFEDGYLLNPWNEADLYAGRGFLYPFLYSASDLGSKKPEGYDAAQTAAALAKYPSQDIPDDRKIDVIAVMLEAYTDLSVFPQIKLDTRWNDPYEFFHQLESESIFGDLATNIFAGGTIDTERCFITGSTELYEYRGSADSYARWFAAQGYDTTFCHAGYEWFYNRRNVAEFLGFGESYFSEGYFEDISEEEIPDDKDFFPALLDLYRTHKTDGKPYFNFSVTYQNHGPYPDDYFISPQTVYLDGSEMSAESYRILSNYLDGIYRTDQALRAFIEALRTQEDPVVVVLFGDHKPWLGDNSSVYAELGIDLRWITNDAFANTYQTQYVIWANTAAREVLGLDYSGWGGAFSPCFLMMKLFDICGWEGDGNMAAMRELFAQMDVIHVKGIRKAGVNVEPLSEEAQALLDQYKRFQYYRMHDAMR